VAPCIVTTWAKIARAMGGHYPGFDKTNFKVEATWKLKFAIITRTSRAKKASSSLDAVAAVLTAAPG